jgi:hypothetical protein
LADFRLLCDSQLTFQACAFITDQQAAVAGRLTGTPSTFEVQLTGYQDFYLHGAADGTHE